MAVDGDGASLVRKLRRANELAAECKNGESPPRVGYVGGQVAQLRHVGLTDRSSRDHGGGRDVDRCAHRMRLEGGS